MCGNKSGIRVQVCFPVWEHTFYLRRKVLREKIVTTLLERILELTEESPLTLKQEEDENGTVTVTITVAIKND